MGLRVNFAIVALRLGISSRANELEAKILKIEKEKSLKLATEAGLRSQLEDTLDAIDAH